MDVRTMTPEGCQQFVDHIELTLHRMKESGTSLDHYNVSRLARDIYDSLADRELVPVIEE